MQDTQSNGVVNFRQWFMYMKCDKTGVRCPMTGGVKCRIVQYCSTVVISAYWLP